MAKKNKDPMEEAMQEALASVERMESEGNSKKSKKSSDDELAEPEILVESAQEDSDAEDAEPESAEDREAGLKEQLMRLAADFDNFRKRSRKELDDQRKFATERVVNDMLPVLDNLERALEHAASEDPIVQGIQMVAKQFLDVFGQYGVSSFEALGEVFDPERHEALSQASSDEYAAGVVMLEHQRGYIQKDRLLRPAKVVVSTGASGEA